ncbi:TPM domain-containing protein [Streptomyces sp. HM190]|uniref:TPM domain-containing protein n=1 Tax=Streptomyces sp. HM190 TaxID=2695266 RepID=UPI001F1E366F|nr:TPM domain-containing protein [Streptomyces sp. HM190]
MAHAAFGGMTALVWLLLVPLTDAPDAGHRTPAVAAASPAVAEWSAGPAGPSGAGPSPFPAGAGRAVAVQVGDAATGDDGSSAADGSSATDLILPVAVAAVVAGFAAYSLVRRKRRAVLRTTPAGTFEEHLPPLPDLHRRGRRLLVETDDCVRTAAEELRFAVARSGPAAARPFTDALADARREVEAAFLLRQRLDDAGTLPPDEERDLLEEILARCTMAQRRLDIAAPAFDQLRALERDAVPALQSAEARFRELTGRTATAAATLAGLRERYAPDVVLPVTGHAELAEDRLVFATAELNRARQFTDAGDPLTAAVHLRAAEGAVDQADVLVTGVERLTAEVARAAGAAQQGAPRAGTLADPFDALCREDRWLLPARSAVATTADYVTTHRAAVGVTARTRLAEAERCAGLAEAAAFRAGPTGADDGDGAEEPGAGGGGAGGDGAGGADEAAFPGDESAEVDTAGETEPSPDQTAEEDTADQAAPLGEEAAAVETADVESARRAHALAREARRLAEQDVRDYGEPYEGPVGDGMAGALLGGIILGDTGDGGRITPQGPACFGGTATRGRRTTSPA